MIEDWSQKKPKKPAKRIAQAIYKNPENTETLKIGFRDSGENLLIRVEAPGVNREDIEVNLTPEWLDVWVNNSEKFESREKDTHIAQSSFSIFRQFASLPIEVLPEKAKAKFQNNALYISVPKAHPLGESF